MILPRDRKGDCPDTSEGDVKKSANPVKEKEGRCTGTETPRGKR